MENNVMENNYEATEEMNAIAVNDCDAPESVTEEKSSNLGDAVGTAGIILLAGVGAYTVGKAAYKGGKKLLSWAKTRFGKTEASDNEVVEAEPEAVSEDCES